MNITVKVFENEQEYIANCPELDINCYGVSKNTAVRRLISVLQFYIESAKEFGLDVEHLNSVTVEGEPFIDFSCSDPIPQKSTLMN